MSSYKGMFEASVITVDSEGEPTKPYYSQETLRNYVTDYLEENVSKFCKEYTVRVSFYEEGMTIPCRKDAFARRVKIALNAKINMFSQYDKSQFFSIEARNSYE